MTGRTPDPRGRGLPSTVAGTVSLALLATGATFLFVTSLDYLFVGWTIFGALACLAVCWGTYAWARGARLWPTVTAWMALPLWATGFGLVFVGLILALMVTLLAPDWNRRRSPGHVRV